MMDFKVGDKVVYSSAMSIYETATVKEIYIAKNAADEYIPWLILEVPFNGVIHTAQIAATPENIAKMKVSKLETV